MTHDAQAATAPQPQHPRDPSELRGNEPEVNRDDHREVPPDDGGATAEPNVDPISKDPGGDED
jgi:hypothetical protein